MEASQIVEVLNRAGCQKVRVSEPNVWCCCPLSKWTHESGSDHRPSCSVLIAEDDTSVFICWGCKAKGTLSDLIYRLNTFRNGTLSELVMWVEERDRPNLNNMLERALVRSVDGGMSVTDITTPSEWILDESVLDGFVGKVPQYVIGRGLTLKTCKFWELGYDEDPLDSRLVFPVRDYVGSLVGMVGRALTPDARIKYRNYSGFHGANFLYGEDKFDPVDDRPIVLVEGMLDVLMSWQHGICQPLGIFGSRLTRERARKLEVLVGRRTILTLFDPDKAGSDARKSVDEHLGGTIPVFHRECPEEKDPGDLDKSELESILNCS